MADVPAELLLDDEVLKDPNPFYRQLIELAPVWRVGNSGVYTVNSFQAVTEACRRRRSRRHVGFGSGIHVCIGNTLARLEARVILECLLAATSEFCLDGDGAWRWAPSLAVRRLARLPLVLTPA